METSRGRIRISIVLLYLTAATISFTQCDARKSTRLLKGLTNAPPTHQRSLFLRTAKKLNLVKRIDYFPFDSSKQQSQEPYGLNSPLSLPPYDSLAPLSLPDSSAPPFCTYPPNTPQTPSTTTPTPTTSSPPSPQSPFLYIPPIFPMQSPPPGPVITIPGPPESIFAPNPPTSETVPSPPEFLPSPTIYFPGPPQSIPTPNPPGVMPSPTIYFPSPPESIATPNPPITVPSPPDYEPSPPGSFIPSPPFSIPSPYGFHPSPPVFEPPIVFPPPTTPPRPKKGPTTALWCVAKPSVPDPIIQEAMNYACGSGADCGSIQPNGSCFEPNSLFAHASFAFNSYWQRTRVAGGTCDFGGTAILVTVDPSYDGCQFDYY